MRRSTRRFRGTVHPVDGLTAEEFRALLALGFVPPMAGGDGENDPPTDPPTDPPERTVPLSELTKARQRAQDAEKQTADLNARIEELESRDQSEVEKANKRAEKAERERDEAKASLEAVNSQRERDRRAALLTEAAREANFHNPQKAANLLDVEQLEAVTDERSARAAVKALAEGDGWLVKPSEPGPTGVEKILANGQPVDVKETSGEQDVTPRERMRRAYAEAAGT